MLNSIIVVLFAITQNAAEHRAQIVEGIESIPVLGTPGTMAVWGDDAFPVIVGKNKSQPIAAAVTYGDGRFFAIAHGSYVSGIDEGKPSKFMKRVMKWVSKKENPRIGMLRNNTNNWNEVDILMWGQNRQLPNELENQLIEWISDGGGVIASACPWGWVQVTGNNLQTDLSQNRVMSKLGMQYGGNYARGDGGVFKIDEIPVEVNAGIALQQLEKDGNTTQVGSGALQYAAQCSPTFRQEVNNVIQSDGMLGPTKLSPIHVKDVKSRLFVTNFSAQWKNLTTDEIVSASGSEDFPETVDVSVPRTTEIKQFDSSVQGWQSSGIFLCAGEVLQIHVTEGNPVSWTVQIGCHKDTLWHKDTWTRWPEITHVVPLEKHLEISTPWGGLVYFESNKSAADITVSISGGVKSPLFDIDDGETNWLVERQNPAPWAEIKGKHLILTVPSVAVRELDNPKEVAEFWDKVVSSHCNLAGVNVPKRPERFVADRQISAGYMHSGYPIMTGVDVATPKDGKLARVVDVQDLKKRGSWGHFHELGHNLQRSWWTFDGTGEVTCNLFSLHAGEVLCGIEPWDNSWLKGQVVSAKKYLEEGSDFSKWKRSPGIALVSYAQLQKSFGWKPITQVFSDYEALPASDRPKGNQKKMDEWVRRISFATEHDLRPFYKMWGMPLSPELLSDTSLSTLPVWNPSPL
ncbi:MAG: hypothetical protein HOC93_07905 [Phycisphaerae bacterium]|nr:hypothetical protein [Phycisphaerae bacterium]